MHPAMSALFPVHKRRKQTSKIQHRVIEPWTTELRCTLCFWSVHQVGVAGQLPGPSSGLQSLAPSKSALLVIVNLPLPPFHAKRSGSRGTVLIAWGTSAMVVQRAVWCGKHLMLVSRSWNLSGCTTPALDFLQSDARLADIGWTIWLTLPNREKVSS